MNDIVVWRILCCSVCAPSNYQTVSSPWGTVFPLFVVPKPSNRSSTKVRTKARLFKIFWKVYFVL
jgi:hypothetical protein